MTEPFEYKQTEAPLLVSFPHDGSELAPVISPERLTTAGSLSTDSDWFIFEAYDFLQAMDVSYVRARYSRYLVDLNRSPENQALYPGRFETSVCPTSTFDGEPIYIEGAEPDTDEIQARIEDYWRPYHHHIERELARLKAIHGYALLWDAHSIRGRIPRLFEGELPDLNFGTDKGRACAASLPDTLLAIVKEYPDYTCVLDGRFKGGYITRHYGNPEENIHAVQLELNQRTYLQTGSIPPRIDPGRHRTLSRLLQALIETTLSMQP